MGTKPRRALPPEPDERDQRGRPRAFLLATSVVALLTVMVAYLVFGPRPSTTTQPSPLPPQQTTSSSSQTTPTPSPAVSQSPIPATSNPPLPAPDPSAPPESPTPGTTSNASATPSSAVAESPPASTAPPAGSVVLNDTQFTAPEGWVLYGDEFIEEDRRVVRLSDTRTDARLQALTLLQDQDLTASCAALIAAQKVQFAVTSEQLARPVGVAPESGEGVTCGFAGVRTSDGVANAVSFTLLRRAADAHVLVLRTTIPESVPVGDRARSDLSGMMCQASVGFGVALPLC